MCALPRTRQVKAIEYMENCQNKKLKDL
jgi:hypothetical protein